MCLVCVIIMLNTAAQRWITVFATCLLHVFRSDVGFYFEKWVNADSQFLTFVVTVLGISA